MRMSRGPSSQGSRTPARAQAVPAKEVTTLLPVHWPGVAETFRQGLASGLASFETEVPGWEDWDSAHLAGHRFVAVRGGEVVGWAAVTPVLNRCSGSGVVEDSVYVAEKARGQGIGLLLLSRLVASTEEAGIWTVQAQVLAGNEPSPALHKRAGFRVVGTRERFNKLDGAWHDVVLLERRSEVLV